MLAVAVDEAAALSETLSQNHPFIDGNKRPPFTATYTSLCTDGYLVIASARQTSEFIMDLDSANDFVHEQLIPWLRKHTRHLSGWRLLVERLYQRIHSVLTVFNSPLDPLTKIILKINISARLHLPLLRPASLHPLRP